MEEILEENKKLKEKIKALEAIINRGSSGNSTAYNEIRAMIIEKVQKEVDLSELEEWKRQHRRQRIERKIMADLKWNLRVRTISDFRTEHIEPAKKYIEEYILN